MNNDGITNLYAWQRDFIWERICEYRTAAKIKANPELEGFFKVPVAGLTAITKEELFAMWKSDPKMITFCYLWIRASRMKICLKGKYSTGGLINKVVLGSEYDEREELRIYDIVIDEELIISGTKSAADGKIGQMGRIVNGDIYNLPKDKQKVILITGWNGKSHGQYNRIYFQ